MHNIAETSPQLPTTVLGRIGLDPARLITVRDWWHEMEEPVELLADPEATYRSEETKLIKLCCDNMIPYRPVSAASEAAFPMWLYREAEST